MPITRNSCPVVPTLPATIEWPFPELSQPTTCWRIPPAFPTVCRLQVPVSGTRTIFRATQQRGRVLLFSNTAELAEECRIDINSQPGRAGQGNDAAFHLHSAKHGINRKFHKRIQVGINDIFLRGNQMSAGR